MVAEFPRFEKMSNCEDGPENNADAADNNVGNPHEGVLATHNGSGS